MSELFRTSNNELDVIKIKTPLVKSDYDKIQTHIKITTNDQIIYINVIPEVKTPLRRLVVDLYGRIILKRIVEK